MKKSIVIFALIIYVPLRSNVQAEQSNNVNNVTTNITNAPEIVVNAAITIEQDDPKDCTKLQGKRLRDCMACRTPTEFRQQMKALPDRTALTYWQTITLDECVKAQSNYNEQQWQEFLKSRTAYYRELFPCKLHVLRRRLRRIYTKALNLTCVTCWFKSQNRHNTDDLEETIQEYNRRTVPSSFMPIASFKKQELLEDFESVKKHTFPDNHQFIE